MARLEMESSMLRIRAPLERSVDMVDWSTASIPPASEYVSKRASPRSIARFSIRLSTMKSATTFLAETPAGGGLDAETEYGGRVSSERLTVTPGAMVVDAAEGVAVAAGILAGALAQAAVQTTTNPDPTVSAARRDRPQAVTWRPHETWREMNHSRWPRGWTSGFATALNWHSEAPRSGAAPTPRRRAAGSPPATQERPAAG